MVSYRCAGAADIKSPVFSARYSKRSTRKQSLTDAGLLFYHSAKAILDNVARGQEAVQDGYVEPRGRLLGAAPVTMGGSLIAPLIAKYQRRFPQVEIELVLSNAMVNLIAELG
jgi:DNA-binding transcriptional LysR family regulator